MGDLKGKLETVLELKSSAEAFFNLWKEEAHKVPTHTPSNFHSVHLHEGDWGTPGSIKIWHYNIGGKRGVIKEQMEVDEEKKVIKIVGLEGDVMKLYKVYNPVYYLEPKGQGCIATCVIEYEKLNPDVPTPHLYMDFMISLTKEIDDSLSSQPK